MGRRLSSAIIFSISVSICLAHAEPLFCTAENPTGQSLNFTMKQVENEARQNAGEICAGTAVGAGASAEDQAQLLRGIRDQAIARMKNLATTPSAANDVRGANQRLRFFMALRHANVLFAAGKLSVVPETHFFHLGGFAQPEPLLAPENAEIQRSVRADVLALNERIAQHTGSDKLGHAGDNLFKKIRSLAESSYEDLISAYPELLFIKASHPTDEDIQNAQVHYRQELGNEIEKLAKLQLAPAQSEALGLIFYGPSVAAVLKANPRLCAAYMTLKAKAIESVQWRKALNMGIGMAAGGACLAAAAISSGLLGLGCLALSSSELGAASISSWQSLNEKQVLYSGVLQGGSLAEFEKKRREATTYLVAAGLSATGAAGGFMAMQARIAPAGRAVISSTETAIEDEQAIPLASLSAQESKLLDSLVARGLMSREDVRDLVYGGNIEKMFELADRGEISEKQLSDFCDFADVFVGDSKGLPPRPVEITVKNTLAGGPAKLKGYIDSSYGAIDGDALVLRLNRDDRAIGYLEYELKDGGRTAEISTTVSRNFRQSGNSEILFSELLRIHPEIKKLEANLIATNREILDQNVAAGAKLEDALKETPYYKKAVKFGFTKFSLSYKYIDQSSGSPIEYQVFEMSKP